jgi:hypothetical protein
MGRTFTFVRLNSVKQEHSLSPALVSRLNNRLSGTTRSYFVLDRPLNSNNVLYVGRHSTLSDTGSSTELQPLVRRRNHTATPKQPQLQLRFILICIRP